MGLSRRHLLAGISSAATARPLEARADPAKPGRLRYQGWAGTVLVAELAEALGYLDPVKLEWVGDTSSGPQDLQATAAGATEFAGAFNGSVMKLIGAGAAVKAVIAYQGADHASYCGLFVPEASPIRTANDLLGRTVGINTLRAQQECFVDQYMLSSGLSAGDVEQVTLVSISPVIADAALRHGRLDAVALSQFFRDEAVARGGLRQLVADVQLYGVANMDSLILRESFMRDHPEQAERFVTGIARAIAWAQERPRAEMVSLLVDIIRKRQRGESELPVRHWRSFSIATKGGVMTPRDFTQFQAWYSWRGDRHTAALPAELIYTNRLNPYAAGRL